MMDEEDEKRRDAEAPEIVEREALLTKAKDEDTHNMVAIKGAQPETMS